MKTLEQVKKFEYIDVKTGWLDDNGEEINKFYINENGVHVEKDYFEKLEKTTIDGIEYVYVMYKYGDGLVIADETQRYLIKVSDLKEDNKQNEEKDVIQSKTEIAERVEEKRQNISHTHINGNIITSIHKFKDSSVIVLNNKSYKVQLKEYRNLTDEDIEAMYGGYAVEDEDIKQFYLTQYIYSFKEVN